MREMHVGTGLLHVHGRTVSIHRRRWLRHKLRKKELWWGLLGRVGQLNALLLLHLLLACLHGELHGHVYVLRCLPVDLSVLRRRSIAIVGCGCVRLRPLLSCITVAGEAHVEHSDVDPLLLVLGQLHLLSTVEAAFADPNTTFHRTGPTLPLIFHTT
jgi:hypothetical protein